jgi:bacterioferritin-associated ferredoxin
VKQTTNVTSGYLCHCLKITAPQFEAILDKTACPSFALMRERHGVGSICSACELEAKGVVADYVAMHPECLHRREGLRSTVGRAVRQVRQRLGLAPNPAAPRPLKDYHSGVFFMRRDGLETRLALANIPFPEHTSNANGDEVRFRATLHGDDGARLGVSDERVLRSGAAVALSAADLFPEVRGDFAGGLYV